jgi:hypothetical protein
MPFAQTTRDQPGLGIRSVVVTASAYRQKHSKTSCSSTSQETVLVNSILAMSGLLERGQLKPILQPGSGKGYTTTFFHFNWWRGTGPPTMTW